MEQTLGKRIVANRKRLGMTQDKLAEQLGVTAQAVSKWENDQACPDITMLPKLAEIFGITTDSLLGITPQAQVHNTEVVNNDEQESDGIHIQKGQWEFKWDGGSKSGLGMALWVLLTGGLLLSSNLLDWGANFWDILWPSGLLIFGIFGLFPRFSFFRLGFGLLGGYFLLSNLRITSFELGAEILLPVLLLLFGLSILADALRKSRHPRFTFSHKGGNSDKHHSSFQQGDATFECSTSFGENRNNVELPKLAKGDASVSFGELTVDLSGCEEISTDCTVSANCSFGQLTILVPRRYQAELTTSTAFGSVDVNGHPAEHPEGVIHIDCSASFGEITVKYI